MTLLRLRQPQAGDTAFATQLSNLATALSSLYVTPTNPISKSQALAAIDTIDGLIAADAFLSSGIGQLTTDRALVAAATTASEVATAASDLGQNNALGYIGTYLTDEAAHGFTISLAPNTAVAIPNGATIYNVDLTNTGTETTTYDLSDFVNQEPASLTDQLNVSSVTLAPGQSTLGGANPVTLTLTDTGNLAPTSFTVSARVSNAYELDLSAEGLLTVNPDYVRVVNVTPTPAFVNEGFSVAISAQILDTVSTQESALVSYAVTDSTNTTVYTSTPVSTTLSVVATLTTVALGTLDTAGLANGEYTITVSVTDSLGRPIPGGTGTGTLLIGTPVTASISTTPVTVTGNFSMVTTTATLGSTGTFTNPLTLVGQVATTPSATSIAVSGTTGYVAGTNGIDIVNISNPTNPTVESTFAQNLIVPGGIAVVRLLGSNELIVGTGETASAPGFSLLIYSIATPTSPVLLSNTTIDYAILTDLAVQGTTILGDDL